MRYQNKYFGIHLIKDNLAVFILKYGIKFSIYKVTSTSERLVSYTFAVSLIKIR